MGSNQKSKSFKDNSIYDDHWFIVHDEQFIYFLSCCAISAKRPLTLDDAQLIQDSIESVNSMFCTNFTLGDAMYQMNKLKLHLSAWSLILLLQAQNLATIDHHAKTVQATMWVWDYLTMRYPIAESYKLFCEPYPKLLENIFGPQMVTVPSLSAEIVRHLRDRQANLMNQQICDPVNSPIFASHFQLVESIVRFGGCEVHIPNPEMSSGPSAHGPHVGSPEREATHSHAGSNPTPKKKKHQNKY